MNRKTISQLTFFDHQQRLKKVAEFDRLPALDGLIPWESFRGLIEKATGRDRKYGLGGRPAFDGIKMFKILVLQRLYNLSDEGIEFRLNDSLSFQRFVDIGSQESVPDAKTIWLFREQLSQSGAVEELFDIFEHHLSEKGFKATGGTIVDASIVQVPRKKVTKENYSLVKKGQLPKSWDGSNHQRRQLDRDARFTRKDGRYLYGYKNHVNVDAKFKLIRACAVTDAALHDSKAYAQVLNKKNRSKAVYADAGYDTQAVRQEILSLGLRCEVQRQRRHTLEPKDKHLKYNAKRSPIRKRIEHIFGHQANSMKAQLIRCVGAIRARTVIFLNNLVYNMARLRFLNQALA